MAWWSEQIIAEQSRSDKYSFGSLLLDVEEELNESLIALSMSCVYIFQLVSTGCKGEIGSVTVCNITGKSVLTSGACFLSPSIPEQVGQLCRDWHAIVDVTDVRVGVPTPEMMGSAAGFAGPHPPASASASGGRSSAAMA